MCVLIIEIIRFHFKTSGIYQMIIKHEEKYEYISEKKEEEPEKLKYGGIRMTEESSIRIRPATIEDASNLAAIYAPYVEHTAITFEYDVPTVEEFADRIRKTKRDYPYLVAERDGKIIGYAYAGTFKSRPAYDWNVETSVYVSREQRRCGIGRRLYGVLEEQLKKQGILNLYACVAYPPREDEYLTCDSVKFHEKLGFQVIGEFHQCGYKFGRWYNMVWLEKMLGEHGKPESLSLHHEADVLSGYNGQCIHRIPIEKVYYYESVDDKVFAYCEKEVYEVKQKLYEIENLSSEYFRSSKSVVLNISMLEFIKPSLSGRFRAFLSNGEEVEISRQYAPILKQKLGV